MADTTSTEPQRRAYEEPGVRYHARMAFTMDSLRLAAVADVQPPRAVLLPLLTEGPQLELWVGAPPTPDPYDGHLAAARHAATGAGQLLGVHEAEDPARVRELLAEGLANLRAALAYGEQLEAHYDQRG